MGLRSKELGPLPKTSGVMTQADLVSWRDAFTSAIDKIVILFQNGSTYAIVAVY